jgi:hypothetical protein
MKNGLTGDTDCYNLKFPRRLDLFRFVQFSGFAGLFLCKTAEESQFNLPIKQYIFVPASLE